jgi:stress response protein YsnF
MAGTKLPEKPLAQPVPDNLKSGDEDVVVPVTSEDLVAEAVPVETGGVRVTKRVHTHDEVVEQQLRTGRVEVKRVVVNRPVDGPLPVRQYGETLIVPVVSEVIRVERQWVLTEEIHVTRLEEVKTVQDTVPVKEEAATVERLDAEGNVIETIEARNRALRQTPKSMIEQRPTPTGSSRVLSKERSIIRNPAQQK